MKEHISETIGCDLGDKRSELCVLLPSGEMQRPPSVKTTKEGFREYFTRPPAHVVIEVGQHSRWVEKLLVELGHRVTVADPRRLKLISASYAKTDTKDAQLLARMGRADAGLLSPVKQRGEEVQADLAVARSRDALVRTRTRLVNHIRGLVKCFGERLPSCTTESFAEKVQELIPQALRPAVNPMLQVLRGVEAQLKVYDKTLKRMARRYPDVDAVSQPKGVGLLTGLVFLQTLEDKTRFRNSRNVGAFVGCTPRKDQSGDSDKQLGITKAGDGFLRRLMVGSANYILGPFGEDSDLRRWGLRLAERGGKNAKRRAKVAVARKLAVLMHRLWVTGEVYEPLRNAALRSAAA
jgi:transposase